MRFLSVFNALGAIVFVFGLTMLVPVGVSWWTADGAQTAYDESIVVTLFAGAALWLATRRKQRVELRVRDGFLLVTLTWMVVPIFGALPLLIHIPGLSITDAYFESASGLTTTGSTILVGIDALPLSINLWRTFLHWLGGMGVIVLVVAVLPLLGIGGRQIFKAETPGPMKENSLTPRIAETAKGLWSVYFLLTAACMVALWFAGMGGWEAVIHGFSIMGLGGFSSHDASLGHFNSLPIEVVAMFFALLSGINFATHFLAFRGKSLRPYLGDAEIPFFFGVLAVSILGLTMYLLPFHVHDGFFATLRYVAFHSISLATSLGLAITDTAVWPMFAQVWVLFLGSFVACSGSTGGGIKMMRAILLYKLVFREITRAMHPRAIHPVRLGRQAVGETVLHAVLAFSFMYMVVVVSLTLLLAASGLELVTAFSAIVATLNNTGPGLNSVGPAGNFAALTDIQKWVCSFAMIIGRLEIFTVLVVFTPAFWRK
ncbi:MAG: TrkH family potassium uptake protein [Rhodocyclales bacterium]|jgi:trk system potassium uptake protein TrkH|nr:TrkH family potassium uptake protein [Rhodocyclales bacterium]